MGDLDWREKPMVSPAGAFLVQTHAGRAGNFEVIIPWPGGGLAHFSRDNDDNGRWYGPTVFGVGNYVGASFIESDFRAFDGFDLGNFEVFAVSAEGMVDHYWRENGGAYVWSGPFRIAENAGGAPCVAYSGAPILSSQGSSFHGDSRFWVAWPNASSGITFKQRENLFNRIVWQDNGSSGSSKLGGIGFAVTTVGAFSAKAGYKWAGHGQKVMAGVSGNGLMHVHTHLAEWGSATIFGRDIFPELAGQFRGRPALLQGDYGYDEVSDWGPFDGGHLGNLELIVPSRNGGLMHFWRDLGEPMEQARPIGQNWRGPALIPGPLYDEVSLIQSTFGGDHGNLEMVARRNGQPGFDFWWRDGALAWHGPQRIGEPLGGLKWFHSIPSAGEVQVMPGTSPTSWYTTPENVQHIAYVGTDQMIHEVFYRIDGENRWFHNVSNAGQEAVMPGTSPTSWYTTPENVQHIAYAGADGLIHECFYRIGGENVWLHSVPGFGQQPVMPGTSPTSWYTTPENVQHIAYIGTDGMIHEVFYRIGGENRWFHNISNFGQVPVMPGTSPTSWYTMPETVQHIAYVGVDQMIHEVFYRIGGDNIWLHNIPSAGREPVRAGTSPTSWYTTPENVQHIAYVGTDGMIHQCFWFVGGFGGWQHEVCNAGEAPVADGTSPTSWYTMPERVQHIAYVGIDGLIHECFFVVRVDSDHLWRHSVPGWGQVQAMPNTSPTSWYTTPENIQHIAYAGNDGMIHECFFFVP